MIDHIQNIRNYNLYSHKIKLKNCVLHNYYILHISRSEGFVLPTWHWHETGLPAATCRFREA